MLSATTRKICYFALSSFFDYSSSEKDQHKINESEIEIKQNLTSGCDFKTNLRLRFQRDSVPEEDVNMESVLKKNIKKLTNNCNFNGCGNNIKGMAKYLENGGITFEKGLQRCGNCYNKKTEDHTTIEDDGNIKKRVFSFQDAPSYLRFNPYITGGYRSSITPRECLKSLFWWTNETINIWTHLIGWLFFLSLSIYDAFGFLELPTSHPLDQTVITLLLVCFQACMLLSSLYHIFCCHSEKFYRRWLSADLLGVCLVLLAIYISGIYYAFSCVPFWLNFYLVTVGAIFATAIGMQILPMVSKQDMVTEENFHLRLIIFGGWAAYGVVPTFHWALLHGGMSSPVVGLLLPRIVWMYVLSGVAFVCYVMRVPERFYPGLVNYIGSSHQLWHVLIVASLYHWHNTGMMYLHFRADNPCTEEYAFLFPNTQSLEE